MRARPSSDWDRIASNRNLHSFVCGFLYDAPLAMALQPGHPGDGPWVVTSDFRMAHVLVWGASSSGCATNSGGFLTSLSNFLAYAGMRLPATPATGTAGVPTMPSRSSFDHRSSTGLLLTVETLKTPRSVDTRSSPVLMLNPT